MSLFSLIGYAFGQAGSDLRSELGPEHIAHSVLKSVPFTAILKPETNANWRLDECVAEINERLSKKIADALAHQQFFCVLGGDHTSAIGTWRGAAQALENRGPLGLIWIDAHMDSHTPETTESGRLHGMPLATLLGYGYETLTAVGGDAPRLRPEHLCLIGVRSFEAGEAAFLQRLGVRVYFMEEVKQRGFEVVLNEAVMQMKQQTIGYGISLDLDSLDPKEIPGVSVSEPDGIHAADALRGLTHLRSDQQWIGMEIAEFNPALDRNLQTEKFIIDLLAVLGQ